MINKNFLIFIFTVQISYGQFLYTGFQEAESWLHTNLYRQGFDENNGLENWSDYKKDKTLKYNKYHNFGFFVNVLSRTNSTIIQENSINREMES